MTTFNVSKYEFRLNPLALLVTLLAIALMIKLGFWQLSRGAEKQQIIDQHVSAKLQGATPLHANLLNSLATQPSHTVVWQAELKQRHYFLIENKIYQGQVGYEVVALASLPGSHQYVPVNLGWLPAATQRSTLPEINLPTQPIQLEGQIYIPETPFLLSAQQPELIWPVRLLYPELQVMTDITGFALTPFMVRLNNNAEFGYVREWPVVVMKPEKHYAYALQWFGLAFAAAAVFMFASYKRPRPKNNKK